MVNELEMMLSDVEQSWILQANGDYQLFCRGNPEKKVQQLLLNKLSY